SPVFSTLSLHDALPIFPGIRLVDLDCLVDLLHPAGLLWGDDAVRQQAARAREVVDEFARLDDLLVGQKPPARIVERRAAQQRHRSEEHTSELQSRSDLV